MTTRIYSVQNAGTTAPPRLVRATHPSHAMRHVAAETFIVRVATQDDIVEALQCGRKVEDLKAEQTELPET